MRLQTIKLAGFKSFVDPTSFHLPSNLTAIVGPNGCGKSNIVDAVRWVIGESSAKQLRGEALIDVIFNGTTGRKPAGQASIELLFDNSDARLGGEYAKFQEISVRREINRDGISHYYLNGTRCRRRDIMDVFLGTGLGPRSYAIIEQGMISQLIEAKPDELRVFLEEAAGISKYKERRRETENRIRHTRENLDRLNDVREEIEKQLNHLQQQAKAAERYKVYQQEQRLLRAQHHLLQVKKITGDLAVLAQGLATDETKLEEKNAGQRHVGKQIENSREQLHELREQFNQVQEQFYRAGAEISAIQQKIQYQQDLHKQYQQELLQTESNFSEANEHLASDNAQIIELKEELETVQPNLALAEEKVHKSQEQLQEIETSSQELQEKWDNINKIAAEATQKAQVEQTRIQHLEHRISNLQNRIERLIQRFSREKLTVLAAEVDVLQKQCQQIDGELAKLQQQINQQQEQINSVRRQIRETEQHYSVLQNELQQWRRREAQLQALQEAQFNSNDQMVIEWLNKHQINHQERLAQHLSVAEGWEHAVELVLAPYLHSIAVDDFAGLASKLQDLNGSLTLLDKTTTASDPRSNSLANKVNTRWPITALLNEVLIANTLTEALAMRHSLTDQQSVITQDGIWLSKYWLRMQKNHEHDQAKDKNRGVISREKELQDLQRKINQSEQNLKRQQDLLTEYKNQLNTVEQQREQQQQAYRELSQKLTEKSNQYNAQKARYEQLKSQELAGVDELQECKQQQEEAERQLAVAREIWQQALTDSEKHAQECDKMQASRNEIRDKLILIRGLAGKDKQHYDELVIRVNSNKDKIFYLSETIERTEQQMERFKLRKQELEKQLKIAHEPIAGLEQELECKLESRLEVEHQFNQSRQQVNQVEHQLRELEQQRSELEKEAGAIRQQLEQIRIDQRTLQVHFENHQEQITAAGYRIDELERELPGDLTLELCEENLTRLENRIQRLGAINLAAIDEHAQLAERKTYLDSQNEDLLQALQTLEAAIQKIDRETKQRLRETYNKVNETFQALFPKIFGGGQASLELLGDDLLNTGVIVRAQPPGKRNTTIHLLSGGEKALTAIALVFSMFQLNPAPFCILDEVDAPLDDNNVVRLSNLLKEMAQHVQFIFISHNKISIETADQLCGITMHEPGVSRLVSVDIDEAIALANA